MKSLIYIDPGEGEAFITRFVPINQKWVNIIHQTSTIQLERIVSLNQGKDGFALFADDEEDAISQFELKVKTQNEQTKEVQYEEEQQWSLPLLKEQQLARTDLEYQSANISEDIYLSERDRMIVNKAKRKFETYRYRLTTYNIKVYTDIFDKVENEQTLTPQELILLTSLLSM